VTNNPKLILQNSSTEYEVTVPELLLGRVAPADLVIPGQGVSGRHARLLYAGGELRIEDVGSTNGTFVNGQRINTAVTLRDGDVIGLGQSVKLTCRMPVVAGQATTYEPPPTPVAPVISAPQQAAPPLRGTGAQAAPVGPPGYAATLMGEVSTGEAGPPTLLVSIAGGASQTYTLNRIQMTIGREDTSDIPINSKIVSRSHARIEKGPDGTYSLIVEPNTSNPTFIDGNPVKGAARLNHAAKIRIGSNDPGLMVSMTYLAPSEAASHVQPIQFGEKSVLQIGRDPANDIILDIPQASRFHAQLERVGRRYRVRDLRSTNGTFVNGKAVEGEVWLQPNDTVRIGAYGFVMGEDELAQIDESGGLTVEVVGVNKWVRKDLNILQNISLNFEPREFIVVVGQSGGGKSTLVDAIAGYRPASHGKVYVNGVDLYENFDSIRNEIGFVPQKDIIHMELTVYQALEYAAKLRMPPDTSREERHKRVLETLDDLDIAHRKDTQISRLSGGQQKRVSIGVELLTRPRLFFLDEPSSGLDPGTETALMQLMRRLADQGRTIILITHATKNVVLADKVVFLARGGYLAWFGAPDAALEYFNTYRSERDQRASAMEFDEIYALLDDPSKGNPQQWAERYKQDPAYQKYIGGPLQQIGPGASGTRSAAPSGGRARAAAEPRSRKKVSALRQFFILSARNLKILTRDRFSLGLMLASAPLVGLLDILLAIFLGKDPFSWADGNIDSVIITLFLLTIYGVMVGGISQMREIVKEGDIYKRERLVNLKIFPYVLSKVWVAGLLAIYQTIWYVGIHYYAFKMPGGVTEFGLMFISLALATMSGMMLGLFASAIAPNANAAPLIVILLMLPQIVLGGALVPVPSFVSAPTATRWAFEGFIGITGIGSDLSKDACFLLPIEDLALLSLEYKNANCPCLGLNAITQDSCDFPAMGKFYSEAAFRPPPVEPAPLGEAPPDPVIPDPPAKPTNEADSVAMAEWGAAMEDYQTTVETITAQSKSEFDAYEAQVDIYSVEYANFIEAQIAHGKAVGEAVAPAEGTLLAVDRKFSWAWANKDDTGAYYGKLASTWFAQFMISGILLIAILIFQKRKDN